MSWRTEGDARLHTIPRQNSLENIWIKEGILYLRQQGYKAELMNNGTMPGVGEAVSVAEINTREDEILYGSFRMVYKVDHGVEARGGSIAGFFAYFVG